MIILQLSSIYPSFTTAMLYFTHCYSALTRSLARPSFSTTLLLTLSPLLDKSNININIKQQQLQDPEMIDR